MSLSENMYQNICIVLSNGKRGMFTGRAICDGTEPLKIDDIRFTLPKELPEGCHFTELNLERQV